MAHSLKKTTDISMDGWWIVHEEDETRERGGPHHHDCCASTQSGEMNMSIRLVRSIIYKKLLTDPIIQRRATIRNHLQKSWINHLDNLFFFKANLNLSVLFFISWLACFTYAVFRAHSLPTTKSSKWKKMWNTLGSQLREQTLVGLWLCRGGSQRIFHFLLRLHWWLAEDLVRKKQWKSSSLLCYVQICSRNPYIAYFWATLADLWNLIRDSIHLLQQITALMSTSDVAEPVDVLPWIRTQTKTPLWRFDNPVS